MKLFSKIDLLIDNPNSWIWKYKDKILCVLNEYATENRIFREHHEIKPGDILFVLSCDKILNKELLALHTNNIVIHESDLPEGKGWSPVSWQVEKGINEIPVTLFEAAEGVDGGDYYIKSAITLSGHELIDQIREKQIQKTMAMMKEFLDNYPLPPCLPQGAETFFPKREEKNQALDIHDSIRNQFNKLRVCDNERYPAHFYINNQKYILKIYNG